MMYVWYQADFHGASLALQNHTGSMSFRQIINYVEDFSNCESLKI